MNPHSRRDFLRASLLLPLAWHASADGWRPRPRLSFSTLGCPDWSYAQVLEFAAAHGYDGIELRGLKRELDLPQCPEFRTSEARAAARRQAKAAGVRIVNLGASTALHHPGGDTRRQQLDQARSFIDLAADLECPYVRVFPNDLPKEEEKKVVLDRIAAGLQELGRYAAGKKVQVLLETHGQVVWTADLAYILRNADTHHTGLIWDVVNMWTVTKEPPALVHDRLKQHIRHVHLKDIRFTDKGFRYVPLGTGEAPLREAVQALRRNRYKGHYSFEWEKLWHPEIEEPEVALADYPVKMKALLR